MLEAPLAGGIQSSLQLEQGHEEQGALHGGAGILSNQVVGPESPLQEPSTSQSLLRRLAQLLFLGCCI